MKKFLTHFTKELFLVSSFLILGHSVSMAESEPAVSSNASPKKEAKNTHLKGSYALSRFQVAKYPEGFTHFSYVNPTAPKGGTLRMATIGSFDSLNKDIVKGISAEGLMMTLDPLMKKSADDPYSWYGLIAERGEVAPDFSTITFYLNPKAKFHDGSPITAEDVKFSLELLRDKGLPRYRKFYSKIEKMEILDPLTLKLTFKKDPVLGYDRELPLIISNVRPLSKKSLDGKDFQSTGLTPLLGSGPYRVKSVDQGQKIVYERVKDYWAADLPVNKGQNNFDEIDIAYFKNDQTLRESFKAGILDLYFETNIHKWQTGYDFPEVQRGDIVKVELEHRRPVTVRTAIFNMKNPLFEDRKVRKAIALAYDFDQMNKIHFHGTAKPVDSLFANTIFVPKGKPSEAELVLLNPYKDQLDPEIFQDSIQIPGLTKAKNSLEERRRAFEEADKLLKDAGWIIKNGVRVHSKTGERFQFVFLIKDPQLEGIALSFKASLKRLGILMEVRRVDVTQYEKNAVDKTFDMIFHSWSNTLNPGVEQAYYFDPVAADQPGSSNYIGVKDQALFALANIIPDAKNGDELMTTVQAFDRAVMGMYYMIPGIYDNWIRFAYWKTKLDLPKIDLETGTNAPEWWWARV
jgi:microcin C transport system substrate-binding protein